MIHDVITWPSNKLHERSEVVPVEEIGTLEFHQLVKDLIDTMKSHHGYGLSAIQIGVPKRVFVMQVERQSSTQGLGYTDIRVFVNPTIVATFGSAILMDEGCLSIPGVYEKVLRYDQIRVQAYDFNLDVVDSWNAIWDLHGIEAQCAAHEIDHFEGITMADSWGPVKRDIARRKIQKSLKRSKV